MQSDKTDKIGDLIYFNLRLSFLGSDIHKKQIMKFPYGNYENS